MKNASGANRGGGKKNVGITEGGKRKNKCVYPFKGSFWKNHVVILWRGKRER